jgi:hypothetical protein
MLRYFKIMTQYKGRQVSFRETFASFLSKLPKNPVLNDVSSAKPLSERTMPKIEVFLYQRKRNHAYPENYVKDPAKSAKQW